MTSLSKAGPWSKTDAIDLAIKMEAIAPSHGYHVALTGGLLYKEGLRKDADFLFYSIRQEKKPNRKKLMKALEKELEITDINVFGWMCKCKYDGKSVDIFFPETKKAPGLMQFFTSGGRPYQ